MDRETVRLIVAVAGVFVLVCIYVWGRYKQALLDFLHRRDEMEDLGVGRSGKSAPASREDDELFESLSYGGRKDGRKEPRVSVAPAEEDLEDEAVAGSGSASSERAGADSGGVKAGALGAPFLIQISVVAGRDKFFPGEELRDALLDLDLIHGDMGIFHRYDRQFRQSLFSVASLVEPGTFPLDDMESFECPGVVLFFQTARVSDPLSVYDDLVSTCHELALRLGGTEWDENRKPLTHEKIAHMRALLENAVDQP